MRDGLMAAMKDAMRGGDKDRLSTIRLIQAAIKDRDILNRGLGKEPAGEEEILQILAKMVKQREDSAKAFDDGARPELADKERAEIAIIRGFQPTQLSPEETAEAARGVIGELGASGARDMGRVMAALKERYAGQMDFGKASGVVKGLLS